MVILRAHNSERSTASFKIPARVGTVLLTYSLSDCPVLPFDTNNETSRIEFQEMFFYEKGRDMQKVKGKINLRMQRRALSNLANTYDIRTLISTSWAHLFKTKDIVS